MFPTTMYFLLVSIEEHEKKKTSYTTSNANVPGALNELHVTLFRVFSVFSCYIKLKGSMLHNVNHVSLLRQSLMKFNIREVKTFKQCFI